MSNVLSDNTSNFADLLRELADNADYLATEGGPLGS